MTPGERQRAERVAKSIANSLWHTMTTEQVERLVEWPDDDEIAEALESGEGDLRPAETLWLALVSWVYTRQLGDPGKHVAMFHAPPSDQMNARGSGG